MKELFKVIWEAGIITRGELSLVGESDATKLLFRANFNSEK